MRFLLDTNLISEVRHPKGDEAVKNRLARLDPEVIFISSIVFAELTKGVLRLPNGKKKRELANWLARLEAVYGDRILPFDRETARVCGKLIADCESKGIRVGLSNAQIAATGIQHGLVVVTRNVKDFAATGAQLWNIWESDWPL